MFGSKNDPVPENDDGRPNRDQARPGGASAFDPSQRRLDYRDDGIGRTDYRPMDDPSGSGHGSESDQTVAINRDQLGGPAPYGDPAPDGDAGRYVDPAASPVSGHTPSGSSTSSPPALEDSRSRYDYVDPDRTASFAADDPGARTRPEDRFITGGSSAVAGYGTATDQDRDGVRDTVDPHVDEREKSGYRISTLGGLLLGIVRILLGFEFLWAFLDKTFGFGFSTPSEEAWINGGKPTEGYLQGVISEESDNPFKPMFRYFADQPWTDWVFMAGLLGIGVCLILGFLTWIAAISGAAMLILMYLAAWPIATNPFLDYHLLQAVLLIALAACNAGAYLGLGKPWRTRIAHRVRKTA